MNSIKKNVYGIVAVFGLPIIVGALLYVNADLLGISKQPMNFGRLLDPIQQVQITQYYDHGSVIDPEDQRKWIYLTFGSSPCDDACQHRIETVKKIRLFTNEKMRRVRTTVVTRKPIDGIQSDDYFSLIIDPEGTRTEPFRPLGLEAIYLIDPLGNIVLQYTDFNLNRMLDDINRLLKYSRIG